MAKKGYPGLVLVPPSDRTILRRRLLHVALFIVALAWGASTLPLWPPASDDKATCQPGAGQESSTSSAENCGQPQSVTEPPSSQSAFSLTQVSQAEGLTDSQNSPPSPPPPDPDQSKTALNHDQVSTAQSSEPADHSIGHKIMPPDTEKTPPSIPVSESVKNPDANVRLADRLATQNVHDTGSKPKSSGPANGFSDHYVAPSENEKSAPSLPESKPTKNQDADARLAEQGDAFAQYRLGRFYAHQDGKQAPEAVRWYKKSSEGLRRLAETGNGEAMYVLGVMYAYGRGVTRSTEEARRWLTRAVEHKITAAQVVLANLEVHRSADPKSQVSARNNR